MKILNQAPRLILTVLLLCSGAGASETTPGSDSTPQKTGVPIQPITLCEALLKAIELSQDRGFFRERVVISISRSKRVDDPIIVQFTRPAKKAKQSGGTNGETVLFKVALRREDLSQKAPPVVGDRPSNDKNSELPPASTEDAKLAKAVATICSLRYADQQLETKGILGLQFEVRAGRLEDKLPDAKGFYVIIWRTPYTPGGGRFYMLSETYHVTRVLHSL